MWKRKTALALALAVTIGGTVGFSAKKPLRQVSTASCEITYLVGIHGLNEWARADNYNMGPTLGGKGGFYSKLGAKFANATLVGSGMPYPRLTWAEFDAMKKKPLPVGIFVDKAADSLNKFVLHITEASRLAGCAPDANDIVIAGYSLGAWITDRFVQRYPTTAAKAEAIVLFGDPQYKPCVVVTRRPDCIRTVGVPDLITDPKNHILNTTGMARGFVTGAEIPDYLPIPDSPATEESAEELWQHTHSYCVYETDANGYVTAYDPVCAFNWDLSQKRRDYHVHGYSDKGVFDEAVGFLMSIL